MRVALFNGASLLNFGGGEQSLIASANYLKDRGEVVVIFDYDYVQAVRITRAQLRELTDVPVIEYHGIRLFGVEELPLTISYLSALMAITGFDVVYTSNTSLTHCLSLRFCSWLFNKRLIFEISDPGFDPMALRHSRLRERIIKLMRKSVISTFANIRVLNKTDYRRYSRGKKKHVFLIPPPSREFNPAVTPTDSFTVLFAGRFDLVQKGVDLLSEVIRRTLASTKSINFIITGSGGAGESIIRELASRFSGNVEWKGFVPNSDLQATFEQSQLFISTSRYETFGLNVLDAQKNGLPVIAFRIPGPSDIIEATRGGKLIPPFDTESFASSIVDFYKAWKDNPARYYEMKRRIAEAANSNFRNEAFLNDFYCMLKGGV